MADSVAPEPALALPSQLGSGSPMDESAQLAHVDASDGAGARQPLPLGCLGWPNCSNEASLRLPGWWSPGYETRTNTLRQTLLGLKSVPCTNPPLWGKHQLGATKSWLGATKASLGVGGWC